MGDGVVDDTEQLVNDQEEDQGLEDQQEQQLEQTVYQE